MLHPPGKFVVVRLTAVRSPALIGDPASYTELGRGGPETEPGLM